MPVRRAARTEDELDAWTGDRRPWSPWLPQRSPDRLSFALRKCRCVLLCVVIATKENTCLCRETNVGGAYRAYVSCLRLRRFVTRPSWIRPMDWECGVAQRKHVDAKMVKRGTYPERGDDRTISMYRIEYNGSENREEIQIGSNRTFIRRCYGLTLVRQWFSQFASRPRSKWTHLVFSSEKRNILRVFYFTSSWLLFRSRSIRSEKVFFVFLDWICEFWSQTKI